MLQYDLPDLPVGVLLQKYAQQAGGGGGIAKGTVPVVDGDTQVAAYVAEAVRVMPGDNAPGQVDGTDLLPLELYAGRRNSAFTNP